MSVTLVSNKMSADAVKTNYTTQLKQLNAQRGQVKDAIRALTTAPEQHSALIMLTHTDIRKLRSQLAAIDKEIKRIGEILDPVKTEAPAKVAVQKPVDQVSDAPRPTARAASPKKAALEAPQTPFHTFGGQLAAKAAARKQGAVPAFVKAQFEE